MSSSQQTEKAVIILLYSHKPVPFWTIAEQLLTTSHAETQLTLTELSMKEVLSSPLDRGIN